MTENCQLAIGDSSTFAYASCLGYNARIGRLPMEFGDV